MDYFKNAVDRDPYSSEHLLDLADMCKSVRRFEDAIHYTRRAIKIAPDNTWAYMWLITTQVSSGQDFSEARSSLKEASALIDPGEILAYEWDFPLGTFRLGLSDDIAADPAAIPRSYYTEFAVNDYYRGVGQVYRNLGDSALARIFFDSARSDISRKLEIHHAEIDVSGFRHQNDFEMHSKLGVIYAYLGEKDLAIAQGQRGMELMPNRDCFW